jgi:S-disulfanyl-L-cysteine oxidoreductase SoxD
MRNMIGITAALVTAAALSGVASAQQEGGPPAGLYSEAQAERGAALYAENCAQCHQFDLAGGELAPALAGPAFTPRWTRKPLSELFDYMRTQMPLNSPGGLSGRQNADVLAFMLKKSGYPFGKADLPATSEALMKVKLP